MAMLKGLVRNLNLKEKKVKIGDKEYKVVGKAALFLTSKAKADISEVEYMLDEDNNLRYIRVFDTYSAPAGELQQEPNRAVTSSSGGAVLDKDRRISRLACLNTAVEILKLPAGTTRVTSYNSWEINAELVMKLAEQLEKWVYR